MKTLNQTGIIEANIAPCPKVVYLTYQSTVYQLSLQEKPAKVKDSSIIEQAGKIDFCRRFAFITYSSLL